MTPRIRNIIIAFILAIFGIGIATKTYFDKPENNPNSPQNKTNTVLTYGEFLDYLNKGWVKSIDFYNNGQIGIFEASSPELGDRPQKIKVEIPGGLAPLVIKLRQAQVNFTSHQFVNYDFIITPAISLIVPLLLLIGAFILFKRILNLTGLGQFLDFGKSPAKIQLDANTGVTFADVAGIEEAKEDFEEVVEFLQKPQQFTAVGAKIPKGVLLIGPPGTGKTLLAKAIAGEAKVPFISISGSEFVEMFVGIGASRVRDLFSTAQKYSPCIVFIDEIDAVGRQRGAGVGGGNDEREQTLNQILTEMDGFQENTGVIVIAATNRVDILDVALLRPGRFDRQVNVNLPDVRGRNAILKVHVKNKKLDQKLSLESIAQRTAGFSGADLANLINEAAILTARVGKSSITMREINKAFDRIIAGLESSALKDTKDKRLVGYHELGHAITGTLLQSHDEVQKITLIPRGQSQGLTWFLPNQEQMLVSRRELVSKMVTALGGRAAEDLIFGITETTTGAGNDFKQATSVARRMVTQFGMSTLGPRALESEPQPVFLGGTVPKPNMCSGETINRIDSQINKILVYSYDRAIRLIKNNRFILDIFIDRLLLEEVIPGPEFREQVKTYINLPDKTSTLQKRGILS